MRKPAFGHSIDISEKAGVRYLHFGSHWVQGAMRIKRPWDLELAYAQDMLLPLLLRAQSAETLTTGWPRNILQIGLGAGSLVKWCYRHLPAAQITAVEINPGVYAAARQFFALPPNDERLEVVIDDGVAWLENTETSWDLILLDGYDAEGRAGPLDSEAFYRLCHNRLTPDGILATNLLGLARTYAGSLSRIQAGFDQKVAILPACSSGNRIILAGPNIQNPLANLENLRPLAQALQAQTGLDLTALLDRLAD